MEFSKMSWIMWNGLRFSAYDLQSHIVDETTNWCLCKNGKSTIRFEVIDKRIKLYRLLVTETHENVWTKKNKYWKCLYVLFFGLKADERWRHQIRNRKENDIILFMYGALINFFASKNDWFERKMYFSNRITSH